MFGGTNNDRYTETLEDTESIYKEFRQEGMDSGAAAGRTLYELGDDFYKNQPVLYFVALTKLTLLFLEEKNPNQELVDNFLLKLQTVFQAKQGEIETFFKELSPENQNEFTKNLQKIEVEKMQRHNPQSETNKKKGRGHLKEFSVGETTFPDILGSIVFSQRIKQRLEQSELAAKSNVELKVIHRIEGGGGCLTSDFEKIMRALDLNLKDIGEAIVSGADKNQTKE